jgi:hypothetical protein
MSKNLGGRESRHKRVVGAHGGTWGSSSQDLARLARTLFVSSRAYAADIAGRNASPFPFAGIPVLLSAFRCLLIELNAGVWLVGVDRPATLAALASSANDIQVFCGHYPVPQAIQAELVLLWEVRNELVHPAHRPGPEKDNTPDYLRDLRHRNLLETVSPEGNQIWLSQLQSHALFSWAFETISTAVDVALQDHRLPPYLVEPISSSYWIPGTARLPPK